MVQEVRILSWCDRHNAEGVRVEGQPYRLSIGELKDREIDLCHECQEELLGAAYEWLSKVGRPAIETEAPSKPRRKKKNDSTQSAAQASRRDEAQVQTSGDYLWPLDQLALAEQEGQAPKRPIGRPRTRPDDEPRSSTWRTTREGGFACPMCESTPPTDGALRQHMRIQHGLTARDMFGTVCPVCAETFAVLGAHAKHHDQPTLWFLFQEAVRLGDPHGVVAERQVQVWNRPFLLAS